MRGASWKNNQRSKCSGPFDPSGVSEGFLSQKSWNTKLKDILSLRELNLAELESESWSSSSVKNSERQLRKRGMKLWCLEARREKRKDFREEWLDSEGSR